MRAEDNSSSSSLTSKQDTETDSLISEDFTLEVIF